MTAITWKTARSGRWNVASDWSSGIAGSLSADLASTAPPAWATPALPSLQPQTLTPVSWMAGVSNCWDTASAWSTGKVPNANSTATIAVAGTYTVTIGGSDAANSLTIGQQAATALVTGSLSVSTSLSVTAGTLALGGDGGISGGKLTLTAGSSLLSSGVVTKFRR